MFKGKELKQGKHFSFYSGRINNISLNISISIGNQYISLDMLPHNNTLLTFIYHGLMSSKYRIPEILVASKRHLFLDQSKTFPAFHAFMS